MSGVYISVIMPAYNSRRFIAESIDSVLAQTYNDFELIIVDDGSTDGTAEIIEAYSQKTSKIRVLKQENRGPGKARLLGVKNTTGKIMVFLDSDDILMENALSKIAGEFMRKKIHILRFQGVTLHGNKYIQKMNSAESILLHEELLKNLFLTDKFSSMWLQAYRKECFSGVDIPNHLIFAEDYLTNLIINTNKKREVKIIDDVLIKYRENMDSTTKTVNRQRLIKNIKDRVYVCFRTLEFLEQAPALRDAALARGLQIEKVRRDMAKLFAVYGEDVVDDIATILESTDFSRLKNKISESDIKEYAANERFINGLRNKIRPRTKRIVSAIYHRDMGAIKRYAKNYRRAIKILKFIRQ